MKMIDFLAYRSYEMIHPYLVHCVTFTKETTYPIFHSLSNVGGYDQLFIVNASMQRCSRS